MTFAHAVNIFVVALVVAGAVLAVVQTVVFIIFAVRVVRDDAKRAAAAAKAEAEAELVAAYPGLAFALPVNFRDPVTGEIKQATGVWLSEPKDKQ